MPIQRLDIPTIPSRKVVNLFGHRIYRSYATGRQNYTRACQGEEMTITISADEPIPDNIRATLLLNFNPSMSDSFTSTDFVRTSPNTLTCKVIPQKPGFHSFSAEFSPDSGSTWLRDNVPDSWILVDPKQVDGMRLYTYIPTVSGKISDWESDLKRIASMGFNVLHLLPVTTLDDSQSPYSAKSLFALDASYLNTPTNGLDQFESYVAAAKSEKMRLCFDLVLNHVGIHSDIVRTAPDWIVPDQNEADGFKRAGYWADQTWHLWSDLVLINYEHPSESIRSEIWAYMTEYALFWANYANETGGIVRLDNLHSSDPKFIAALSKTIHDRFPEVGILAEYFTDDVTVVHTVREWGLNLLLATPWVHKFVPQFRDYLKYIHHVSGQIRYFMPLTSHDGGSPAQEFGTAESTVPRYVAAALLGTGATGITQGTEFGKLTRIDFIGRQAKIAYPTVARFAEFIKRVNDILVQHPAFRAGENCQFVDEGHLAIIAAFRRSYTPKEHGFLVVCNYDIHNSQSISVDVGSILLSNGTFQCVNLLKDESEFAVQSKLDLMLEPCGAQVLRFLKS